MKYLLFFLILVCASQSQFIWAANMTEQVDITAGKQFTFTATTTSQMVLPVNQNRAYLIIQNSCSSTDTITVNFRTQETAGTGVQLPPCSSYEPAKVPTNSVWVKSNSSTQTAIFVEGATQGLIL